MKLSIQNSVGEKGTNNAKDVKLIRALLNTYHRKKTKTVLPISLTSDQDLVDAITEFQKSQQKLAKPDGQVTSSSSDSFKALVAFMKSTRTNMSITKPDRGILTWEAEGNEGGRFHSRVLHVPSNTSGLTIGRGYDMKDRSAAEVKKHLVAAGVDAKKAEVVSKGAGLFGNRARVYILEKDLLDFEISANVQLKLFSEVYKFYVKEVKRISNKKTVVDKYGKVDWEKLDADILDVLVDLRFRGDYTGSSRKMMQKTVSGNDFEGFKKVIIKKESWGSWPADRFSRRKEFLDAASKEKRKKDPKITKAAGEGAKVSQPKVTGTPE